MDQFCINVCKNNIAGPHRDFEAETFTLGFTLAPQWTSLQETLGETNDEKSTLSPRLH